ncbi:uncharacterized protein TRIADDRAFT_57745 [Trichoplax adhaerens]|uniref:Uncharacterized protein n=1 Tax=Trichoplax adhaerens TaxID=10228 RepID=B3S0A7_TRIAD|nr:hypothetical protein TRIADDRAFT_57745 [Trichoplax adhaerens]EDV23978.1 hypothetical protein TRIADDRAFT_57745 [Trichoplax adhaerens]|eukprot:XP_002113504.1 hypothetical protein TRIADDRAFT_57745 [Trichoplax adhaerens]
MHIFDLNIVAFNLKSSPYMPDDGTPPLPPGRPLQGGIMTSDASMVSAGIVNQQPSQSFADSNFLQDLSSSFRSLYKTVFSLDNSITENGTISGNDQVLTAVNNLGSSLDNQSTVSMNSYDSRNSSLASPQHHHQQHHHHQQQQQQQQRNPMSLHQQSSSIESPFIEPNGSINLKSSAHLFSSFSDVIQSFTDSSYWRNADADAFRGLMDSMKTAESKNWILNQSQFLNLQNSMNYFNSSLFRSQNDSNGNCIMDNGNTGAVHTSYNLSNSAPTITRSDLGGQSNMNGNFQQPNRPHQQQQAQMRQLSRSANASFYGNVNNMNQVNYNNNRMAQLQDSQRSHCSLVRRSPRIARNLQLSNGSTSSRSSYPESYNSSGYKYPRPLQRPSSAQSMHSSNGSNVSIQQRPSAMGQVPMPTVPMMQTNVQNAAEEDEDDFDWASIM